MSSQDKSKTAYKSEHTSMLKKMKEATGKKLGVDIPEPARKDIPPMMLFAKIRDLKYLEGQLLTLIDAAITDKEQREAMKTEISNKLWDWRDVVGHRAFSESRLERDVAHYVLSFIKVMQDKGKDFTCQIIKDEINN